MVALGLYGFVAALQPSAEFGRVLAAYGGVFVVGSLLWGAVADGFRPDRIHIAYSRRLMGGWFSANVAFTDHPLATRLGGDYPVVTVRSIVEYLERSGRVSAQREWRNGQPMARLGAL